MTGRPVALVIDESAEVCAVVRAMLTLKGFDVVEAHDPASAAEALKGAEFATIFLDMKMPHDGTALLDYIAASYPDLLPKVIVMMPFIHPTVCATLTKPLDLDELSSVITSFALNPVV
jgi:CheY-like chemotaxis protein